MSIARKPAVKPHAKSRRWRSSQTHPLRKGWYEVRRVDGSEVSGAPTGYRAWGNGQWWLQLADGGWFGRVEWRGLYQWRGPRIDIVLDYADVIARVGGTAVAA